MEYNCRSYYVSVLVVSDCAATLGDMKARLEDRHKYNCFIRECADLAQSFADQAASHPDTDIVLVDFGLIGTDKPRAVFQRMTDILNKATIIVFNNSREQGFALSMVEDDSPDGINGQDLIEDEFNLFALIERCLARAQNHRRLQMRNRQQMAEIRRQWQAGGWPASERNADKPVAH